MTTARGSGDSARAVARSTRLRARTVAAPADRGVGTGVGAGSVLTCPTLVAPPGPVTRAGGESVHGGDFSELNPSNQAISIHVSTGHRGRLEQRAACGRGKVAKIDRFALMARSRPGQAASMRASGHERHRWHGPRYRRRARGPGPGRPCQPEQAGPAGRRHHLRRARRGSPGLRAAGGGAPGRRRPRGLGGVARACRDAASRCAGPGGRGDRRARRAGPAGRPRRRPRAARPGPGGPGTLAAGPTGGPHLGALRRRRARPGSALRGDPAGDPPGDDLLRVLHGCGPARRLPDGCNCTRRGAADRAGAGGRARRGALRPGGVGAPCLPRGPRARRQPPADRGDAGRAGAGGRRGRGRCGHARSPAHGGPGPGAARGRGGLDRSGLEG